MFKNWGKNKLTSFLTYILQIFTFVFRLDGKFNFKQANIVVINLFLH